MKLSRFDFWFIGGIFLFNILLKLFRLDSPEVAIFDEGAFYIPAANEYLNGGFGANFEHPPVAKLFMSAGILIFGNNLWGWRIPEVWIGSLGIVFIYLLAKSMFSPSSAVQWTSQEASRVKAAFLDLRSVVGARFIPILASVFLTFEFSWFTSSRIATLEIFVATFSLGVAYFFWNFFKTDRPVYLALTGIFAGLAVASKWNGLFILAFLVLFYLWYRRREIFRAAFSISLIFLIGGLVYLGSYSFYLTGHSIPDLVNLHIKMFEHHLSIIPQIIREKDPLVSGFSPVYAPWVLVLNPPFPYNGENLNGNVRSVLFLFNPALFWGSIGVIIFNVKKLKISKEKLFLTGAFLAFWVPWFFGPRYALPYYILPSIPFGIILLSKVLEENYRRRRFLFSGFIVTSVLIFFFYYPLLANIEVPVWYFRILTGSRGFTTE